MSEESIIFILKNGWLAGDAILDLIIEKSNNYVEHKKIIAKNLKVHKIVIYLFKEC